MSDPVKTQRSPGSNTAVKLLSVVFSILFLWGAGISLVAVIMNLGIGFSDSSGDYNDAFLQFTSDRERGNLISYVSVKESIAQRSEREAGLTAMAESYAQMFSPEKTNFRFAFTEPNGKLILTNDPDYGSDQELLSSQIDPCTISYDENSYTVRQHYPATAAALREILTTDHSRSLNDPTDFEVWFFTNDLVDNAYHNGMNIMLLSGAYTRCLKFPTLRAAQEYDYASEFGEYCDWELVPDQEREAALQEAVLPYYNDSDTEEDRLTEPVLVRVSAYSEYAELTTTLEHYLELTEQGNTAVPTDRDLGSALQAGLDLTISARHIEGTTSYLRTYLPADLPVDDTIRANYTMFRLLFKYSEYYIVALFVCIVLTVICAISMCSAAGYRDRSGTLVPSRIHSISYEFFWLIPVLTFLASLLIMALLARGDYSYRMLALFGAGLTLLIAASLILWLYTTAVRIKCGSFWKSFFFVRMIRGFFSMIKSRALATVCAALWFTGTVLFTAFAWMFAERNSDGFMLLIPAVIADLLTLVGLIYCIYAYFELRTHVGRIETGDFSPAEHPVPLGADFAGFDRSLDEITDRVGEIVARQTKAEHLRTELITNVSHDLKTPLTSIVNYVDLLTRQPASTPEAAEYLEVLSRQAARLKKLTLDLVEASKASTGNLTVELMPTDVRVLIGQLSGEYEDKLAARALSLISTLPEEPVSILADGRLIWRVFDNLLGNACKYAMSGTRIYLDVFADREKVMICLKNISAVPLNISPDELMERFVRGDSSRHTEGSGLGLSIAKDLTALQNGKITLHTDGDLFKVVIEFPRYLPPDTSDNPAPLL